MADPLLLVPHATAGTIAILAGAAAFSYKKGSRPHRMAGNVFFVSMLALAASGTVMALIISELASVIAGVFTLYLVATAWATVKRKEGEIGRFEKGAALFALAIAILAFTWGMQRLGGDAGDGLPAPVYFMFGMFAALAALFDFRMIRRGGVMGAKRILRHLGRMGLALYISTASLFLGQQQLFPDAVRESGVLAVPLVAVIALTLFWLIRVRFTKWYLKST